MPSNANVSGRTHHFWEKATRSYEDVDVINQAVGGKRTGAEKKQKNLQTKL